jgi:osmotically-inducible protein OsmY
LRHEEIPEDRVLVERVRSEIGHVLTNPGTIGVTAVHGQVTLSGPVPADEVDQLLRTVGSVRGVTDVVNQVEVHDETEHISGLQGKHI